MGEGDQARPCAGEFTVGPFRSRRCGAVLSSPPVSTLLRFRPTFSQWIPKTDVKKLYKLTDTESVPLLLLLPLPHSFDSRQTLAASSV